MKLLTLVEIVWHAQTTKLKRLNLSVWNQHAKPTRELTSLVYVSHVQLSK